MKRLALVLALLSTAAEAQLSTRANRQLHNALTPGGIYGMPRYTTALLPTCATPNLGALAFDTTVGTAKVCNGTSWIAASMISGSTPVSGCQNLITYGNNTNLLECEAAFSYVTSTNTLKADNIVATTTLGLGSSADALLSRTAAGSVQLGVDVNGAPVAQVVKGHNGITGSNIAGASLTLEGGIGTGTGVGGSVIVNRPIVKASGTTVQTYAPSLVVCPSKTLSNTSAQAQTIATITTTTTTGGTVTMDYGNVACSGSTCDTDSGIVKVSWNNNAGTVAAAMTAVVGQSDSDATGTLAATPTATVATNVVSIKLTPTWVTIVPTSVTSYAIFTVHSSADTVVCQ